MKLTIEESEQLLTVMDQDGFKVINKMLDILAEDYDSNVLKVNLDDDKSEQKLLYEKCRSEGAGRIVLAFKRACSKLRETK